MFYALVIIYCLLFTYLSYKKKDWTIFLVIVFLPSYLVRFSVLGLPLTLLEAMILILFVVFLWRERLSWVKEFKQNPFFWPIIVILVLATVAVFVSPNLKGAGGIWKAYFIEPILFLIVLISWVKDKKQVENIFWALGISAVYLCLIGFWQYFSGWNMPEAFLNVNGSVDRIVSIFGYPNALGLYLGPIIILFTGFLFFDSSRVWRLLKLAIIVVSFVAIILAKSEAAAISVVAVWLIWALFFRKVRWWALAIIIIAVVLFFATPAMGGYLNEKLMLQDYSGMIRRLIWQESWEMLKDNWFFGAGLAGYQTKIAPYHAPTFEIFLYPHNIILNFWSEVGILGLLSFMWLGLLFLWKGALVVWRSVSRPQKMFYMALVAVMTQMVIHGMVDAPYFKNDLSVLFWIVVMLLVVGKKIWKSAGVVERGALEKH